MKREAPQPRVEIVIDELRLVGFDPIARAGLGERVKQALAALISAEAGSWRGAPSIALPRLDAGLVRPGATRAATAQSIAAGIHLALTHHREARASDP